MGTVGVTLSATEASPITVNLRDPDEKNPLSHAGVVVVHALVCGNQGSNARAI